MEILRNSLMRGATPEAGANEVYVRAAVGWLCRAQDASKDGGVAHSFSLTHGWTPSYPETTGYIIPTMLNFSRAYGDASARTRALRMADWLVKIQLDCGGIQSGTIEERPVIPTVFNTGQVLLGWIRAYEETGDGTYLRAARKAADWLTDIQDADGAWRNGSSPQVRYTVNTYNTRTAWALHRAYEITGSQRYLDASLGNVTWALTQQTESGWFKLNCLSDTEAPLTHTIAYALRGLLETGMSSGDDSFIRAARKSSDALLAVQRRDGSLAGRYSDSWAPRVSWSCLTGNAQMAIIWGRLYQRFGEARYLAALQAANRYVRSKVDLSISEPGVLGGVSGSWPLWAEYTRLAYPNWAAKFFVDALMLEDALSGRIPPEQAPILNG